jgi:N-acetylneuraminate synthase
MTRIPELTIRDRKVGYQHKPLVIAEIGINHGGSLEAAMEMVDSAVRAGAEVIKHQTHVLEDEMSREARSVIPGNVEVSIYDVMASCALDEGDEISLKDYVESKGVVFLSTPFSKAAVDRLVAMDVPAFKVGSGECNNYPLIEYICTFKKPVILSTGMNSFGSIDRAVGIFRKHSIPFALLHCTNLYPTPHKLVRLNAIKELEVRYEDAVVGLSDHTVDNYACLGAVALGSSVLERHFTDHKDREGPDIVCSMDEEELARLIEGARIIFEERGGTKGLLPQEKVTSDFAYASVVSVRPIDRGEKLTRDNIWVRRPGTGEYLAKDYDSLLGRQALVDIEANTQISKRHIEPD